MEPVYFYSGTKNKEKKMKKVILIALLSCIIVGCAPKKPPLAPTQVVDGKSIIIPPEFDTVPDMPAQEKK